MKKILISDDVHPVLNELLTAKGYKVEYRPEIIREDIKSVLKDCVGLVIRSKTHVDPDLLRDAAQLRIIARAGAGVDNVDLDYLKAKGIILVNAPEGNRDALGEHVVGMLLNLMNKINISDRQVREKKWNREPNRGMELKGRTVGIFGYGNMGSAVAEKLSRFGCRVIAYDKKKGYSPQFAEEVGWDKFLSDTQILSIHVPLTEVTSRMFDGKMLDQFPKLEIVLNSARGEILVLSDLIERLEKKQLVGACLDVLENEKIPTWTAEDHSIFDRLKVLDNVVLTPHVGGWTYESYRRISEVLADKIISSSFE